MASLRNKTILLGVTGSIAAYKAPTIVRECVKRGATVHVVMTPSATNFVTPLVLQNLSKNPVAITMFDDGIQENGSWHIHKARECDIMLIAPCSAHTLASMAHGFADSALACLVLALPPQTPLIVAPAMDTDMWLHPAVQRNVQQLKNDGAIVITPDSGELASGLYGVGRLPDPVHIVHELEAIVTKHNTDGKIRQSATSSDSDVVEAAALRSSFTLDDALQTDSLNADIEFALLRQKVKSPLAGKRLMISAGTTHEAIDDVRFISNHSTGKMGVALANAAIAHGCEVTFIHGPMTVSPPSNVQRIAVQSAHEMYEAVMKTTFDIGIFSAAVADFTPANPVSGKMKKSEAGDSITLQLRRTQDILAECGKRKKQGQFLVGFALETENLLEYAERKLVEKNCDMIVANQANTGTSGFGVDVNTITLVVKKKNGELQQNTLPTMSKQECANKILEAIAATLS